MHPRIMGARRLTALRSITSSVEALASSADLEIADPSTIRAQEPRLQELFMLEWVADLLERLEPGQGPTREEIAAQILEIEGLTKTSQAAIEAWAEEG